MCPLISPRNPLFLPFTFYFLHHAFLFSPLARSAPFISHLNLLFSSLAFVPLVLPRSPFSPYTFYFLPYHYLHRFFLPLTFLFPPEHFKLLFTPVILYSFFFSPTITKFIFTLMLFISPLTLSAPFISHLNHLFSSLVLVPFIFPVIHYFSLSQFILPLPPPPLPPPPMHFIFALSTICTVYFPFTFFFIFLISPCAFYLPP